MRIDIISCVPDLLASFFSHSILKRGQAGGVIEVHVHNLRKKFFPELIRTVRGVGYLVDRQAP